MLWWWWWWWCEAVIGCIDGSLFSEPFYGWIFSVSSRIDSDRVLSIHVVIIVQEQTATSCRQKHHGTIHTY